MNNWLAPGAGFSALTFLVHIFAGGPNIGTPLLRAQDIRAVPKFTHYYCWHIVSLVLLAMACGFCMGAWSIAAYDVAALMTLLALGFTIWSIALVLRKRQKFWLLPQWALFLPITVCAALGLWK
jgi:hypothetical protein